MDKQKLRQIAQDHLSKHPLDESVLAHLFCFKQVDHLTTHVQGLRGSVEADELRPQIEQACHALSAALILCRRNGKPSWEDVLRCIAHAKELADRLHEALPMSGSARK